MAATPGWHRLGGGGGGVVSDAAERGRRAGIAALRAMQLGEPLAGLSAEEIEERVLATQLNAMRACTTELGRLRRLRDGLQALRDGPEFAMDDMLAAIDELLVAARDPEPES